MHQWLRRFRRPSDQEFSAEVEAHLAHEIDEQIDRGIPPEEARYAALRRFGNVTRHLERFREASPWFWLETLWRDVRYGWRSLWRSPVLFGAAVVTLSLGIGASTALFSVLYCTVISPLPYPHSDRLATLVQYDRAAGGAPTVTAVRATELAAYAALGQAFEGVAGAADTFVFVNGTDAASVRALYITCNFFDVLGLSAKLGRVLHADSCTPTGPAVVVLSEALWMTRFGGDPHVIGHSIRVDRRLFTVIGVMPSRASVVREELWIPTSVDLETSPPKFFMVFARLNDGVEHAAAAARVATVAARLVAAAPADHANDPGPYGLRPLRDQTVREYRTTVYALFAGAGCLLLLACANVAALLFARGIARQLEIGVRVSLGASVGRVVRQLLVESLLLAVCGGLLGVLFAVLSVDALSSVLLATEMFAPQADIRLKGPALLVAALTVIGVTLATGLAPSLYAARRNPGRLLIQSFRVTGSPRNERWRMALVAGQIAIAFPLFCATAALLSSFHLLGGAVSRYEPEHVVEVIPSLSEEQYGSAERREQLWTRLDSALEAVPGVVSAASTVPFLLFRPPQATVIVPVSGTQTQWQAHLRCASADFFSTMRVPLVNGRIFTDIDQRTRRRVAIVSRSFAAKYFGTTSALGQRVRVKEPQYFCPVGNDPLEIVATVEDVRVPDGLDVNAQSIFPTLYAPLDLGPPPSWAHILVRTKLPARTAVRDMRQALASVDPGVLAEVRVLQEAIDRLWTPWPRLVLVNVACFAGVGLALMLAGVFGVLTYSVEQRTREIGVRLALGASPRGIAGTVIGRGLQWMTLGIVAGMATTVGLYGLARNHMWGLEGLDPVMVAAVSVVVLLTGLFACWLPARRAMSLEPTTVLRAD